MKKQFLPLTLMMITITTLSLSGCAITSGLQTYDLPQAGTYQTDLGTSVEIIQITQNNLEHLNNQSSSNHQNLSALINTKIPFYKLSPGDILSIHLWAYPEITPVTNSASLTNQAAHAVGFRIDQQGNILFPLIGNIRAEGKTVQEFTKELRHRLSKYLKHPDVIVRVIAYESKEFSVLGNVSRSGQYFLNDKPTSLYSALGMAGGINLTGDNTAIQLVRNGVTYDLNLLELERNGYSIHDLFIQPNDTIYVGTKDQQKLYVMGESGKNQALIMREKGMNLSDVLGESLGLNPLSASASRIYLLRTENQKTSIYHLNLNHLADFGLASQFKVQSNDIVYVDATGLTRWQRIVNQMLPFSSALYNVDRLGN